MIIRDPHAPVVPTPNQPPPTVVVVREAIDRANDAIGKMSASNPHRKVIRELGEIIVKMSNGQAVGDERSVQGILRAARAYGEPKVTGAAAAKALAHLATKDIRDVYIEALTDQGDAETRVLQPWTAIVFVVRQPDPEPTA